MCVTQARAMMRDPRVRVSAAACSCSCRKAKKKAEVEAEAENGRLSLHDLRGGLC